MVPRGTKATSLANYPFNRSNIQVADRLQVLFGTRKEPQPKDLLG